MDGGSLRTQCCIAGRDPAGLVLCYLLACAGVRVIVLEKHADFLRDFRDDTIHPSTLTVRQDLGLLEAFFDLRHQGVRELSGAAGRHRRAAETRAQPATPTEFRRFSTDAFSETP